MNTTATVSLSPAESAVLISIVHNVYGGADVSIPAWAHNESHRPHRFPHQKAGGAIRTLKRKGHIAAEDGTIHLTASGIDAGVSVYLDTVTPDLRDLAERVIATVREEVTDPAAWIRRHGRDAAQRAIDEIIDGDIYRHQDLLYVVEAQIKSWMHEKAEAMADAEEHAIAALLSDVEDAPNLVALQAALRAAHDYAHEHSIDAEEIYEAYQIPHFGGPRSDDIGVYSWDRTSVLVIYDNWAILPRGEEDESDVQHVVLFDPNAGR